MQHSLKIANAERYYAYRWNEGESAASFCHQLAALFPDMFCNFYLVKNHKIAHNSTTAKAK
jgi:hypothetical protein